MAKKGRLVRTSSHPLVRWWWGVDRTILALIGVLMTFGLIAVTLASPAVSDTYAMENNVYYFAKRQLVFALMGLPLIVFLSYLSPKAIRNIGFALGIAAIAGIVMTLFSGVDVKGASRWVRVAGLSLQPTELLKPAMIIVTAYLLSRGKEKDRQKNFLMSIGVLGACCGLIFLQPDFGMVIMLSLVWGVQVFMSGAPLVWLGFLAMGGLSVIMGAYLILPHVKSRFDRFIDPSSGDSYQVDQAREALLSGGMLGTGPGEGVVKYHLPDAHTDFIFAVIAEEFGIITCILLLCVYGVIVVRGLSQALDKEDRFIMLASVGLLVTFTLQALFNMGVVLNVLPTTGMTLPFISYGGSAMLGLSFTVGFLLALIRKRGKHAYRS